MKVLFPPLFRINAKENGNFVRQLAVPAWAGEAAVEPYHEGRVRGFMIVPADGSPSVLLLPNTSQPGSDISRALGCAACPQTLPRPLCSASRRVGGCGIRKNRLG